jgi:hypothetical protein
MNKSQKGKKKRIKKMSKRSHVLVWLDAKQKGVSLESPRQNKNKQ